MNRKRLSIIAAPFLLTGVAATLELICPGEIVHYPSDRVRYGHIPALVNAVNRFQVDAHRYPGTDEGLAVLVAKPDNAPAGWRPYLRRLPKDAWGNAYLYRLEAHQGEAFMLYSKGADGRDDRGLHDDIVNWDKDYPCGLIRPCPTACEMVKLPAIVLGLLAWLALIGLVVFRLLRVIVNRLRA